MPKVTDLLIAAAKARLHGQSGEVELARVLERYAAMAHELGLPTSSTEAIAANLHACLLSDTTHHGRYLDTLKAAGEDNCARLVAEYLRALGHEAAYVNPRDGGLVLSDEPGNARVLEESYAKLAALRDHPGIVIFPGFFGYSPRGAGGHLPARRFGHHRRHPGARRACRPVREFYRCGFRLFRQPRAGGTFGPGERAHLP